MQARAAVSAATAVCSKGAPAGRASRLLCCPPASPRMTRAYTVVPTAGRGDGRRATLKLMCKTAACEQQTCCNGMRPRQSCRAALPLPPTKACDEHTIHRGARRLQAVHPERQRGGAPELGACRAQQGECKQMIEPASDQHDAVPAAGTSPSVQRCTKAGTCRAQSAPPHQPPTPCPRTRSVEQLRRIAHAHWHRDGQGVALGIQQHHSTQMVQPNLIDHCLNILVRPAANAIPALKLGACRLAGLRMFAAGLQPALVGREGGK